MTIKQLADAYGVNRARMNVILNSQVVTPACAGRVAETLEVDVTEALSFGDRACGFKTFLHHLGKNVVENVDFICYCRNEMQWVFNAT